MTAGDAAPGAAAAPAPARPWTGAPFRGAKLALLRAGHVLTLRRDDHPGLPFPGHWDLPGGGREGAESPADCALRETAEEVGLRLSPARLLWHRAYAGPAGTGHFFAGWLTAAEIATIRLGDEGQEWRMMPLAEFLSHLLAVPQFRDRLRDALAARPDLAGGAAWS